MLFFLRILALWICGNAFVILLQFYSTSIVIIVLNFIIILSMFIESDTSSFFIFPYSFSIIKSKLFLFQ